MGPIGHLNDEAVAAFADGALGPMARLRALRHVESCPDCAEAVEAQREAARALRCTGVPAPSDDLLARLRSLPSTAALPPGAPLLMGGQAVFPAFGTVLTSTALTTGPLPEPPGARPSSGRSTLMRHGAMLGVAAAAITFGGSVAVAHDTEQTRPSTPAAVVRTERGVTQPGDTVVVAPAALFVSTGTGH